ncbi:Protein CBG19583 [Caenorhabditis briggsae]|uniref:Protein CBG19583 n=1 Tax=Caenorhabditis briggsae TaxID=6238 RepID=A8XVY5_CAEBR|nr:Protein CBG19583 [Caenorhabditis briggsae]CAP36804.2 Protein CBG19583 [Caenorhabditis briggsae]
MFRIPPILLLLLSTFVHARDLGYFHGVVQGPKEILQNHLDIFQKALDAEEKATLMRMFPETEAPDESAVEILIIKHHNLKMEVIEAKREIAGQITGEVNYSRAGGGNEVFSVTIMTVS